MIRVGLLLIRGDTREDLTVLHCDGSFVLTVLNVMCQLMLANQVLGIEGTRLKFAC